MQIVVAFSLRILRINAGEGSSNLPNGRPRRWFRLEVVDEKVGAISMDVRERMDGCAFSVCGELPGPVVTRRSGGGPQRGEEPEGLKCYRRLKRRPRTAIIIARANIGRPIEWSCFAQQAFPAAGKTPHAYMAENI